MSQVLSEVARLVRRESGVELGPPQFPSLAAAVARIEPGMTPERLLAMERSEALIQQLINAVTIRETFFFRHLGEFQAIGWHHALEAANARGSNVVRVWVAGCASGEEAYSLAILACEAFSSATPPVHVVATDIATAALERARGGRYGPRAMATTTDELRRRYFTVEGELLCVGDPLRRLIDFRRQNLVSDVAPDGAGGRFDVISCRNVLIYFDPPTAARVLRSLESALAPAGTLVLGAADALVARPVRMAPSTTAARSGHAGARAPAQPRAAAPSRSPVPEPARARAAGRTLHDALAAANRGALDVTVEITTETLARDPLNADALYLLGLAELARGDARAAIASLRRAVYIDADFSPALFKLARAYETLGRADAARQVYVRTLRSLSRYAEAPHELAHTVDLADIAVACHARLGATGGDR